MGSLRVTVCTGVLAAAALSPTAYAADTGDAGEKGTAGRAGSVSVSPATAAPGTDVTLRVTGCPHRTAVAVSPAFVTDARLTVADAVRELTGESRVRSALAPGTYSVRVPCGDTERTGTFTVRKGTADGRPATLGTDGLPATPGSDGLPATPGSDGQSATPGTDGRPATPGSDGQPLTPGTGGPPPLPGGGRSAPPGPGAEGDEPGPAGQRPGAPASPVAPVRAGGGGAADVVAAEERAAGPGTAQGVTGLVLAGVAAMVVALRGLRRSRGTG
ncbi:hypothetical protein AB0N88_00665 [Streptomyces sp. NPDC093516]|uniref:hypothetical protein n=1 Tax=Streptomyces sp. NPDC093516 TaxID=3155304 RepID=UPI003413BA01